MTSRSNFEVFQNIVCQAELTDGTRVCIRAIRSHDETRMRQGIAQLSDHSRYLRFFSRQTTPSDKVIQKLIDVDGYNHMAWGAVLTHHPENPAIGSVHAFRDDEHSQTGELSFAIIDAYHGLGLARMLMAVLLVNCRLAALDTLDIHVLWENKVAVRFAKSLGGMRSNSPSEVSIFTLDTETGIDKLREQVDNENLQTVLKQLDDFNEKIELDAIILPTTHSRSYLSQTKELRD